MTRDDADPAYPATATVSSLNSDHSTEQLICKTPPKDEKKVKESVCSKSVEDASVSQRSRAVVWLGLAQVVCGALLVGAGGAALARGASLARTGAGLWAGALAVAAGAVGLLAGAYECYPANRHGDGNTGILTAFLAMSLLCLACGHSAAVLAATGLQRDSAKAPGDMSSFQEEMDAWTPVLANISLLIISCIHCLLCIMSIYHVSRRVCSCLRPKQPFDHNQFQPVPPTFPVHPYVVHVDEGKKGTELDKPKSNELAKELEAKLSGEVKKKKEESSEAMTVRPRVVSRPRGVRKRPPPAPLLLLHPHPATTMGRMPMSMVVPARYHTLPMSPYAPAPAPIYYPAPNARMRRRGRRSPRGERRRRTGDRDSQLTRSLERIHRKRRAERNGLTDAELKRTYTGLDRAYAEQFIAVCDESRQHSQHDSLTSTTTSDSPSPAPRGSPPHNKHSPSRSHTDSFGQHSA